MVRRILNWHDKKWDGLMDRIDQGDDKKTDVLVAFGLGGLEGFIDSAALVGTVVFVTSVLKLVKPEKK